MKLNKFFSLLLVMFIFSYVSAFCEEARQHEVRITRSGGGGAATNGYDEKYDDVWELHQPYYHALYCYGDGNITCFWIAKPSLGLSIPDSFTDDMFDYAEEQMELGNYLGTYVANFLYDNQAFYRSVVWSGTMPRSSTIQVFITPVPLD